MNHNLLRDEIKDAEIVCHAEKKQYAEALKGMDGKSFICNITPE